jgi:hypothetical protein
MDGAGTPYGVGDDPLNHRAAAPRETPSPNQTGQRRGHRYSENRQRAGIPSIISIDGASICLTALKMCGKWVSGVHFTHRERSPLLLDQPLKRRESLVAP